LTKICIAANFIKHCYVLKDRVLRRRSFEFREFDGRRTGKPERNWVHLLINIVRQGIRLGDVSEDNPVVIVTFNYDKILEKILEEQFSNTEANYFEYWNYIRIIHVHGACGDLNDTCANPASTCLEWAEAINVVNEATENEALGYLRSEAREKIVNAEELYFCGFSFAGPNCRLLGLKTPSDQLESRTISYCNYDGNVGLAKIVDDYKEMAPPVLDIRGGLGQSLGISTYVEDASGTVEKPISVADWLRLGYLGELPG